MRPTWALAAVSFGGALVVFAVVVLLFVILPARAASSALPAGTLTT